MKGFFKKIQYNSPVVLTFALISLIALILNYITGGASNKALFSTYRSSFTNPMTYVRLFTYVLGHADLNHFMANMSYFLLLGPIVEEKYGSKSLLLIIAVTACTTALISTLILNVGGVGASGIVFCFIILSSVTSVEKGKIPLTLILVCLLYMTREVYNGIFVKDNISQFGHIMGGIFGCICGFVVPRKYSK